MRVYDRVEKVIVLIIWLNWKTIGTRI